MLFDGKFVNYSVLASINCNQNCNIPQLLKLIKLPIIVVSIYMVRDTSMNVTVISQGFIHGFLPFVSFEMDKGGRPVVLEPHVALCPVSCGSFRLGSLKQN